MTAIWLVLLAAFWPYHIRIEQITNAPFVFLLTDYFWTGLKRPNYVHLPNFDFCHSFIVMTPKWHLFCCTFKIIVAFHFNKVQWSTFNFKRPYFQVSPREEFFFDTIIILLLTYMIITYVISSFYKSYSLIKPTYIIFSEYDYRCLL